MIIVMQRGASRDDVRRIFEQIEKNDLRPVLLEGTELFVIAVIGDERKLCIEALEAMHGVERVMRVLAPYKLATREHRAQTEVTFGGVVIGGVKIAVIAGPCTVESRAQTLNTARAVAKAGACAQRGGAFKPRTSPYDFQGMGEDALKIMAEARAETGLPIVTEILTPTDLDLLAQYADVLQIGTRNMQNFRLLDAVGRSGIPVLLKRGMSATIDEFLLAAEYVLSRGNENVILCERGIRTFEKAFRNTLALSAVPYLKEKTHLPVVVDPSHGTGVASLVTPMSRAAVACGADGLLIEVTVDPESAMTDGHQSLAPEQFAGMMRELAPVAAAVGRVI